MIDLEALMDRKKKLEFQIEEETNMAEDPDIDNHDLLEELSIELADVESDIEALKGVDK